MRTSSFASRAYRVFAGTLALQASLGVASNCVAASLGDSPWVKDTYSKARLVSGTIDDDGKTTTLAGVQIRLSPGWKTYWRTPGDSGVPPSFDWSGSKNLKSAQVLYPAPHRFADAGGTAIGYADEVVFPVKVTPEREGEPVELKLNVSYGLCKTLCIPNEAKLTLELPPQGEGSEGEQLLLQRYLDLVPRPVEKDKLPALGAVENKLDATRPELLIEALFPEGTTGTDLFAEAQDVFVPVPKPVGEPEGGKQRFAISFGSAEEAQAVKDRKLTLTLVWEGGARETTYKVE
jgi:DsbC/DsbD-like thiol-disulfide interchange protein